MRPDKKNSCIMTVDVEDYFEVGAFDGCLSREAFSRFEPRLKRNVKRILDILEDSGPDEKATFFVLGGNAKKYPKVIREIHSRGHEIACHGHEHKSIYSLGADKFRQHARTAKSILEDITGDAVLGFRAPNFSVRRDSLWALEILWEEGFLYDSSLFPVLHDRYGIPDAPRRPFYIPAGNGDLSILHSPPEYVSPSGIDKNMLVEFPLTTFRVLGRNIAVAGGGYLRLYPYRLTRWGIDRAYSEGIPLIIYLHPWEIDPGQPRIKQAPRLSRFRHYTNLHKTESRLKLLLKDYAFDSFKRRWFDGMPACRMPEIAQTVGAPGLQGAETK